MNLTQKGLLLCVCGCVCVCTLLAIALRGFTALSVNVLAYISAERQRGNERGSTAGLNTCSCSAFPLLSSLFRCHAHTHTHIYSHSVVFVFLSLIHRYDDWGIQTGLSMSCHKFDQVAKTDLFIIGVL